MPQIKNGMIRSVTHFGSSQNSQRNRARRLANGVIGTLARSIEQALQSLPDVRRYSLSTREF